MDKLEIVENTVKSLLMQHSLDNWNFKWKNSYKTYGTCNYRHKTIGISKPLAEVNTIERTKQCILHEIAHALTPGSKHGKLWKQKCIELGITPEVSCSINDTVIVKGKYVAKCTNCGTEYNKYRKPKRRSSCSKCSNKFDEKYELHFK